MLAFDAPRPRHFHDCGILWCDRHPAEVSVWEDGIAVIAVIALLGTVVLVWVAILLYVVWERRRKQRATMAPRHRRGTVRNARVVRQQQARGLRALTGPWTTAHDVSAPTGPLLPVSDPGRRDRMTRWT